MLTRCSMSGKTIFCKTTVVDSLYTLFRVSLWHTAKVTLPAFWFWRPKPRLLGAVYVARQFWLEEFITHPRENYARYYVNLWSGYLPMRTGRGICTPTRFLSIGSKPMLSSVPAYPHVDRLLERSIGRLSGQSYHQEDSNLNRQSSQPCVQSFVWWHGTCLSTRQSRRSLSQGRASVKSSSGI